MIMTRNTKWQLTCVKISFKLNWVGRYLVFFQHHRLLFFTTTQRTSQREEEFKSTIGCSVDRPVSLTNCFEQHSKSAILEIVGNRESKIKGDKGGSREVFWRTRREKATRKFNRLCFGSSPFSILKRFNLIVFHCGHICQSKTPTIIPIPGLKCYKRDDEARIAIILETMGRYRNYYLTSGAHNPAYLDFSLDDSFELQPSILAFKSAMKDNLLPLIYQFIEFHWFHWI